MNDGAAEIRKLAADLSAVSAEALPAMRRVIQQGASDMKAEWQANARATSGTHGKHYPNSITYETKIGPGGIQGEVGPDSSKPQGSMGRGFEFGSVNQPPHLDGLKAVDKLEPLVETAISQAVDRLMP